MALLQGTGVSYVANDRCVLHAGDDGTTVRGLPTLVSIRIDALDRFPGLEERLAVVRPDLGSEAMLRGTNGIKPRNRFSLSPPEFYRVMGDCPRQAGGPMVALVFPRITDQPTAMRLRRVEPVEAAMFFRQGLFRASHAGPLAEVFVSARGVPLQTPDSVEHTARRVAESVTAFDCELGGGMAPGPEQCRELIMRIRAEGWRRSA
jgi:hypothetical protein